MRTRGLLAALLCIMLVISNLSGFALADGASVAEICEEQFTRWNPEAPAL